jgi:hypothetical protein
LTSKLARSTLTSPGWIRVKLEAVLLGEASPELKISWGYSVIFPFFRSVTCEWCWGEIERWVDTRLL